MTEETQKYNPHHMFSHHPWIEYGNFKVRDFTRQARILQEIRENDYYSADYFIQEGETPTSLAQDLYKDPSLFWVLLNLNDIIDPWTDWPMRYWELVLYVKDKYGINDESETMFWGFNDIWYRDYEIEHEALPNNPWATDIEHFKEEAYLMSYFDYENIENDERRYIRIVRPNQIDDLINDYRKEIRA